MPMDSIWSDNGVPSFSHLIVALYFAFSFFLARLFLDRFVFRRLAICLLRNSNVALKLDEATHAKIVKFSESMWKLTYCAATEVFILKIAYKEPWFLDTKESVTDWPHHHLRLPLKIYYMCQCGFYTYAIFALLAWETRRKDFAVMMSHHVITVFLIGISYLTRLFQIGSIVLCLHDVSDLLLEAAKVFKYSDKELAATVVFGCFAASWLILRLIVFPFWIIKTSSYNLSKIMNLEEAYDKSLYYVLNTMLIMLFVFHIYWWILICAMIGRQFKSREVGGDIRSDSEDED